MITATITSFDRFHLLEKCIRSLLQQDISLVKDIIVGEDSVNREMIDKIHQLFRSYERNCNLPLSLQFNPINKTQPGNIDALYRLVKTPYILHIEDDYMFDGSNKSFVKDSIDILEERQDLHSVWIRCLDNYQESHNMKDGRVMFGELKKTKSNVEYREFTGCSVALSWMPHIHRLRDYNTFFPQGYLPLVHGGARSSQAEGQCGEPVRWIYKASTLEQGICRTYDHRKNSTYK